jgi:hypothetical protein
VGNYLDYLIPLLELLHLHALYHLLVVAVAARLLLEVGDVPHLAAALKALPVEFVGRNNDGLGEGLVGVGAGVADGLRRLGQVVRVDWGRRFELDHL